MAAKLLKAKLGEAGGDEEGIVTIEVQVDASDMVLLFADRPTCEESEAAEVGPLAKMLDAIMQEAIAELDINDHPITGIKLTITPL